MSDSKSIPYC